MSRIRTLLAFTICCLLVSAPAASAQGKSPEKKPPTAGNGAPVGSPDHVYGAVPKGKAHGVRCRGFSKKKVKGQKGTPFSRCVRAMAQLEKGKTKSPAKACKGLSRKKVKKGTLKGKSPYAACVSQGKALLKEKAASGG